MVAARSVTVSPASDGLIARASRLLPVAALLLAVLSVSSSAILIRSSSMDPLLIAGYRTLFASLILAPFAITLQRADLARIDVRMMRRLVGAGLFLAAHFGLWPASLGYTTVATSVVLVSTHPIFVGLIESVRARRRPSTMVLGGMVLAILGGIMIAGSDLRLGSTQLVGDLLALGAALAMVGYLTLGRSTRQHLGFLSYSAAVYAVCAMTLLGISFVLTGQIGILDRNEAALLLSLAVIPTIGGHTVFNWTLRRLPTTVVSTAFLGEPLGASVLAWLVLDEIPSTAAIAGGLAILVGLFLTVRHGF